MYPYKHNNLTCLVYNDDCFNNKECDFKIKIVVKMWKNWRWKYCKCVLKYECECIKNTKSVKWNENFIQSNKMIVITFLCTVMVEWINETMIVSLIVQLRYFLLPTMHKRKIMMTITIITNHMIIHCSKYDVEIETIVSI